MRTPCWRWRAGMAAAVVLAVMASSGTAAGAAPAAPPAGPARTAATPASTSSDGLAATKVTLITGDVVTFSPGPDGVPADVSVQEAPRADGMPVVFTQVKEQGAYYVYPSDGLDLVTAGRLDKRLFDVMGLATDGYADDKRQTLPVIVQYAAASARDGDAVAKKADALPATDEAHGLPSIAGATATVAKAQAARFWAALATAAPASTLGGGVSKLWLDGQVKATLDQSVPQIGAPQAWQAGYTGTGVKVAVLDTGVDPTHPDLAGRIAATADFTGGTGAVDHFGHGTHVASIVLGSGAASGGKYKGVAPGAALMVGKVLDDSGNGPESEVIAGMQWAASNGARIVSMSLGACCTDGTDPMSVAVNQLSAQYGTLFVVAAGNSYYPLTVGTPGAADAALTVGAVDKQDKQAPFASRGPRMGDYAIKPDITAPGVGIVAARAAGTSLGPLVGENYVRLSGTSMATPHVSGAAAILAQEHPQWTGQQLKAALVSSAKDVSLAPYDAGSGRVDVARAVSQDVFGSGNLSFGRVAYPQTGPVTRTLTYTNTTAQPVTLALTATVTPGPAGTLSVSPSALTVPANGTGSVTVALDLSKGGPATFYQGMIEARSAGGIQIRSAVAGYQQPKPVVLRANVIAPDGATDVRYSSWTIGRVDDASDLDLSDNIVFAVAGAQAIRTLDAGRYTINTAVTWRDSAGNGQAALLTDPEVDLSGDRTVTLDARLAREVRVNTPQETVREEADFGYHRKPASGRWTITQSAEATYAHDGGIWALPTRQTTVGSMDVFNQHLQVAPPITMALRGSDHTTLHPRYIDLVPAVAKLDGKRDLRLVNGGAGRVEDFTGIDARGKLVLLNLSDLCPTAGACASGVLDRLANAAKAGAVAALAFGAVGRATLVTGVPALALPTMTLPAGEGQLLLGRPAVTLDVRGTPQTPYTYTLAYPYDGRIPQSLANTAHPGQLYRFDSRYHADAPGEVTVSWNTSRKVNRRFAGSNLTLRAPSALTEYVGPVRDDLQWSRSATLAYDAPADMDGFLASGYSQTEPRVLSQPGHDVSDWGQSPLVPSGLRGRTTGDADFSWIVCLACRSGNMLVPMNVLDNTGLHNGYQQWYDTAILRGERQSEIHLYRSDGTEIPLQVGAFVLFISYFRTPYFTLPPQPDRYRMTSRYFAPYKLQRYGREVDTTWTFSSGRPTDGFTTVPPIGQGVWCSSWFIYTDEGAPKPDTCQPDRQLYLGYDLNLSLDNTAPAGRAQTITIDGYHDGFLTTNAKVRRMTIAVSYDDGASWQNVPATATKPNTYAATLHNPSLERTSGAVSLKVSAEDTEGNTVEQTTYRAFGLTAGHGRAVPAGLAP